MATWEKEVYVRGSSFFGAYSEPTVKVTLSLLNHLHPSQRINLTPSMPTRTTSVALRHVRVR